MTKKNDQIYQFKITLKGIEPTIWRRIQVPEDYSFWDLHVAIQNAMGWTNSHLYEFTIINPKNKRRERIGSPDDDFGGYSSEVFADDEKFIRDYFSEKDSCDYEYDFGDGWEHKIMLEKILPVVPDCKYPVCIDGKRACPPEDCGSTLGYERIVKTMRGIKGVEYKSIVERLGIEFDPEKFDPKEVYFEDPKEPFKLF
jgi:hypothetical protein